MNKGTKKRQNLPMSGIKQGIALQALQIPKDNQGNATNNSTCIIVTI